MKDQRAGGGDYQEAYDAMAVVMGDKVGQDEIEAAVRRARTLLHDFGKHTSPYGALHDAGFCEKCLAESRIDEVIDLLAAIARGLRADYHDLAEAAYKYHNERDEARRLHDEHDEHNIILGLWVPPWWEALPSDQPDPSYGTSHTGTGQHCTIHCAHVHNPPDQCTCHECGYKCRRRAGRPGGADEPT